MSSKIGFLLSLIFLANVMLFGGDLIKFQIISTQLMLFSTNLNNQIVLNKGIDQNIIDYVSESIAANIIYDDSRLNDYGEIVYYLEKSYQPTLKFIFKNDVVSIKRVVLVDFTL